ncbi:MAG: DUF4097 family beta strand repeat protein [Acidobacteriaceae bacterium]|nr:DUF4097 family beta strand repeat protein [Acidobacteriaceae bacterium]MBV9779630.1 DUF4097 family beta strand repeat protein [Acidobacteriaceae bacterium]
MRRGSIAAPLILIAIGALFLIHEISPVFPIADMVGQYWPYLLILWGVLQVVEISVRALRGRALPVSGISAGGWFLVVLICFAGFATYEVRRPDNWWRRVGFEPGIEVFGQEHQYQINSVQKTVGNAPHIVIETFRGDAKITGNEGTDVVLNGHKIIRTMDPREAERADQKTPVDVVVQGNTVTIRCNQSAPDSKGTITTDLDLSVPKDASIEATGMAGDFDVSSISGDVDISSQNSGVRLTDIGGNVKVDTRRSDLVRCTNIRGAVDLRGHGSDVELEKIAGQVTINGDYDGTLSLRELARPVRVQDIRTEIDAEQVPGEIRLDRGSLNAQNLIGPVKVNAHATDITLDGFNNGLELTADKSDIELRPARLPLAKMMVHTRSGNIEVALPETATFALTASTDHGEIENEFGEALKQHAQGPGARLEGAIGTGPELTLTTDRGSITVRKSSGEEPEAKESDVANRGEQVRLEAISIRPR